MTPRQERENRTRLEIERGREVAMRYTRQALVEGWVEKKLVEVVHKGNTIGLRCGAMFFEEADRRYPSVELVASVQLAINAGEHNGKYGLQIVDYTLSDKVRVGGGAPTWTSLLKRVWIEETGKVADEQWRALAAEYFGEVPNG